MSQISVNNLTFYYDGSFDNIFENVSFTIDTDWKLGFVGRNGKGKTTFLNLLSGKYEYLGSISASVVFDYFPYQAGKMYQPGRMQEQESRNGSSPEAEGMAWGIPAAELMDGWKPGCEQWRVICELDRLGLDSEVLYRPFCTLSFGEQTKVMLAVLFSGENDFLLIDEPTNHLDREAREIVKSYLAEKKGFILVSHDRDLLDACTDHILVLNRCSIEVQAGNFSCWWENKSRKDAFARMENEKHVREIAKLKEASLRARQWAEKSEGGKIGFNPLKEHDRASNARPYIGAKTKKMQSRVRQMEVRLEREIEEKEGLLQDIENPVDLKLMPMEHYRQTLVLARDYSLKYRDSAAALFEDLRFEIQRGERVFLNGSNGCGKTSLIKAVLERAEVKGGAALQKTVTGIEKRTGTEETAEREEMDGNGETPGKRETTALEERGTLQCASGLIVSYISQDTSFLRGNIREFCRKRGMEESLFCAVLRQLDFERVQFGKNMEDYSEGQKKKVLIAASLLTPAHLYVWDEPLNYIDVFSRMQIEKLLLAYCPTMLVVEHDVRFRERIATKTIQLSDAAVKTVKK